MTYITKTSMSFLHPPFPLKEKLNCEKQPKPRLTINIRLTLTIPLGPLQYQMQTPSEIIREIMAHHT